MKRFTRMFPCPICKGYDSQARGKRVRCGGYLSSDGRWAHCTRVEAGRQEKGGTWAHRLSEARSRSPRYHPSSGHAASEHSSRQSRKTRDQIVNTYNYRRPDGTLLFQVLRYEPKSFKQRRPADSGGRWIWNLDGVARVLYRLPELLESKSSVRVFVPEGEKDVDSLVALGLVATTNPGGAGKWCPDYASSLVGRHVVVLPDADEAGHKHAENIARSLEIAAASVRILHLPNLKSKGDITDWIHAGGTAEKLNRLAQQTPNWKAPTVPLLSELLDLLVLVFRRFVAMSAEQAEVCALWTAHTHAIAAAEATPYLWLTSPEKRSGKTRLLEVLDLLVAKPWLTGRTSPAVLVRKIDAEHPTLLLDEGDAAFGGSKEYAETLRGILNTGHRASGKASLCVGQGRTFVYKDFSTFSPKAIAGIGKLPDTVEDRAIPIRLRRKAKTEPIERFRRREVDSLAAPIRSQLEAWSASSMSLLKDARPPLPEPLSDRAQDGAEPLLAIADLAGGRWPQTARTALVQLCGGESLQDGSLGVRILRDCRTVFETRGDGCDRLSSEQLLQGLLAIEESPWHELYGGRMTKNALASRLKPFDVGPRTIRLEGPGTVKGYYRASFEDAWDRYVPL